MFEDGGAGVGGGACGEDIVDEEDGSAGGVAGGAPAEVEGGFEIEETVFAAEGGLGGGVAEAAEGVDDGEAGEGAEGVGEFSGLVEFAFAEAARVSWAGAATVRLLAGLVSWTSGGRFVGGASTASSSISKLTSELVRLP